MCLGVRSAILMLTSIRAQIGKESPDTVCFSCSVISSCDPMDCSPPGTSAHAILHARIMERVAMPFSRGNLPNPKWNLGLLNYRQVLHCLSHQGGSKIQSMQKRVSVLRTKNRDKVGTASAAGQPPDRPGRVRCFWELIANFYSLKIKENSCGRLVLGDWLECYLRCLL